MTDAARARSAAGVRPALVAALLAMEAATLVLVLRPSARRARAEDASACAREREDAEALAERVEGLRARLYDAELRLASSAGGAAAGAALPAPTPEEVPAPEEALAPEEAPAPPSGRAPERASETGDVLARIAEVQARETADPIWAAAAESRLRDVARALVSEASVERVLCTGTLCRVELLHGGGPLSPEPLDAFVVGMTDLMPQATIQPDAAGGKTTVVFARTGSTLPAAGGGGG